MNIFTLIFLITSPLFLSRLVDVRPYFLASLFILASIFLFLKYLNNSQLIYLFMSAFFLSFAPFAQNLFLVGIIIPAIYFFISRFTKQKMPFLHIFYYYLFFLLVFAPWFIHRFYIAQFDFYRSPITWMYSEGFWSKLNIDLWHRATPRTLEYYSYFISKSKLFFNSWLIFVFVLPSLFKKITKEKILLFSWIVAFTLPIIFGKVPTETRYLFPLIFPISILLGEGLTVVFSYISKNASKLFSVFLVLIFVIFIMFGFYQSVLILEQKYNSNTESIKDLETLKPSISKGNIYFRSHLIAPIFPENHVYSITDLDLEDAKEFIAWGNENNIYFIVNKYEIRYIILYKAEFWEKDFHSWLTISDGREPLHYINIEKSECFKQINESRNYKLFEFICK